ncbi:hypothetical protein [Novipirellula artificiosorum]|uniref:Uncharacterized protein n=1 Tax=Novipirellula artificiosorum TaxID=2528016 RepID=A0A5C6D558_9BACT|nr:hypothetical protein [Novipirellula artificiosorum]TWU32283.1 hypothetical protein Poly41_57690 [Novipirellula artificiosorum]
MDLSSFTANPNDMTALFAIRGEPQTAKRGKAKPTMIPLPKHAKGERFIRGPIPLAWFKLASGCGNRAEAVAVLLWYMAGCQNRNPVKMTPNVLSELSVHPKTARRVLQKMADKGLVLVEFKRGRSPLVTIVSPESAEAIRPTASTDGSKE